MSSTTMDTDAVSVSDALSSRLLPEGSYSAETRSRRVNRARVTRACDRCKKYRLPVLTPRRRKTRCTGLQPCGSCEEALAVCTYNSTYCRGRHPPIFPAERTTPGESTQRQFEQHVISLNATSAHVPNSTVTENGTSPTLNGAGDGPSFDDAIPSLTLAPVPATEPVSRASPEPTQTDLQGHYVGPSSGVSFLLRVQKRLDQSMSFPQGSSIFNFGDAPLPHYTAALGENPHLYFDPSFSLMLSRNDTSKLVQRFFNFAVPVDRFLHRPTVERWLDEFYGTMGKMDNRADASARTAVLFMIFAIAQEHMVAKPTAMEEDMSIRYFMAATQQLSKEQGTVRLESVQARLLQCLWLLSQSRINHCWSLFGTVARLAFAIGLHRNRVAESLDNVQIECRRRTFWSAYSLDNYLSTALGRPRTFHEDDIDQELPASIDDKDLAADKPLRRPSREQSVMFGPVAYSRLSKILSGVLHDVYSIRPTSLSAKFASTAKYTKDLKTWRSEMRRFLDLDLNAAPLILIFQRQRNVLNLAYWHTMILTHRPHLLSNFARLQNGRRRRRVQDDAHRTQTEESIKECLGAAMSIVQTVDDIIQAGQLFRAFWFTPYFAFSASVILYVYTIQKSNEPPEVYRQYFEAAGLCQDQIANIAEPGSLTSRYCLILDELRAEVVRQTTQHEKNIADVAAGLDGTASRILGMGGEGDGSATRYTMDDMQGLADMDVSPSDSLEDLTGWDQFDSMVISGLSGLESFLDSERFGAAQQFM
ncbi:fungal specific transcription factor domain-containing protein [Colletotrichum plurivorum]|uniref:Fungal specific transcription factor domain-containing protein n=1 Tax=Colletotrichum plurivorum TaxID=2175906 RepID=A0A8H6N788_9PEZI|nr:fungal specific transcription factor domain-containing protein [Colletotrichum plurivorum]